MRSLAALVVVLGIAGATAGVGTRESEQSGNSAFEREDYFRWIEELSNWGRWGDSDEIGAMNLVTPEKLKQAAALVKSGVSVSLAQLQGPNIMADGTRSPYQQTRELPEGYEERVSTEAWTSPPAEDLLTLPPETVPARTLEFGRNDQEAGCHARATAQSKSSPNCAKPRWS